MSEQQEFEPQEQEREGWGAEEQARQLGWRPLDEFQGDPENHIDAETFLERAENDMPLLRSNNRRLNERLEEMSKTMQELREFQQRALEKADQEAKRAEQAGYERAMKALVQRQQKAIEDGDSDTFAKAEQAKQRLTQQRQEQQTQQTTQNEGQRLLTDFRDKNPDIFNNFEQYNYFEQAARFAAENGRIGQDVLDFAKAEVEKKFGQQRTIPGPDDGGSNLGPGGSRKRTFDMLPKEAKDQYFRFKKEIERQGGTFSKEDYVNEYVWD